MNIEKIATTRSPTIIRPTKSFNNLFLAAAKRLCHESNSLSLGVGLLKPDFNLYFEMSHKQSCEAELLICESTSSACC